MSERVFPNVRVKHASPNWSHRSTGIHGITIHAAVMHPQMHTIKDLAGLGNFFGQSAAQVSSHVATDGDGWSARFVADHLKAWHVAGFNSQMLGIEQIIMGDGTGITEALYDETARWCALWHRRYGVPLVHGRVSGSRITRPGVFTHKQLGVFGGGHVDPGPRYDMDHLLRRARHYARAQKGH